MDQLFKEKEKEQPRVVSQASSQPEAAVHPASDAIKSAVENGIPVYVSTTPPQRRRSRFIPLGCGTFLLLVLLGMFASSLFHASGMRQKVAKEYLGTFQHGKECVAVVRMEGPLSSTEGFMNDQIDDAFANPNVKAVVLRIDSPGGTVFASDHYYGKIVKLSKEKKIPVVVSMGATCASGGYYIAMAVGNDNDNVIFAEPATLTGSIGVVFPRYNLTELAEKVGVEPDFIVSHPLKGMGSMLRSLTEEERAIFQSLVDDSFAQFKEVVYSGRKRFRDAPEKLDMVATGEVFTLKQALANGLVDKNGRLEDAIARAQELAELDPEQSNVFIYKKREGLINALLNAQAKTPEKQALEAISNTATPRAYYLWSQMPGLE